MAVGSSIIFGDKDLASYKVSEEPDEEGPADPAPSGTIKVDGEDAKKILSKKGLTDADGVRTMGTNPAHGHGVCVGGCDRESPTLS